MTAVTQGQARSSSTAAEVGRLDVPHIMGYGHCNNFNFISCSLTHCGNYVESKMTLL